MTEKRIVVLGGGGHAGALIEALQASGAAPVAVLDGDSERWGETLLGVPIRGGDDCLPELMAEEGINAFVVGVGGAGDNALRRRLFEWALEQGLEPVEARHPTAYVAPSARLGRGCQLLPGAIVHTGATLGDHVLVNTGAIVEHDCRVGDHAHLATGAKLGGGVTVEAAAHVGLNASVRQGIRIGAGAVIGAGAAVVGDIPPGETAVGVPAKPLLSKKTFFIKKGVNCEVL